MKKTMRRILSVDDDRDTCQMLEALLGLCGYEVISALTVAEGLSQAKAGGFDLYLLDNWLPDGTGVELCQQIRKFDPRTPVLFCSGVANEADIKKAMSVGAQGYLVKPTDVENLTQTISACLATAGLQSRAS
jgi:DNA-binding response OmpR family regulator